jgi:hypothetical protein
MRGHVIAHVQVAQKTADALPIERRTHDGLTWGRETIIAEEYPAVPNWC